MSKSFWKNHNHFVGGVSNMVTKKLGRKALLPQRKLSYIYSCNLISGKETNFCDQIWFAFYYEETLEKEFVKKTITEIYNKALMYDHLLEEIDDGYNVEFNEYKTINKFGVYVLYNKDKELIYIGKSNGMLKHRSISSIRERKAMFVQYMYPKTKTDTSIYEIYLIGKHKPLCNKESKSVDELTITLPEIESSELMQVYTANY